MTQKMRWILQHQIFFITAPASVQKDTLQMYFEQFTEQFELAKHGNNSWILKLCSQAGMIYEGL